MIEKTLISLLSAALSVPVYAEEPSTLPDSFVLIEKTGSDTENRITRSTVAVQSWAQTLLAAAELNEAVKDAMLGTVSDDDRIGRVSLNSDYNFTDTETRHYRYQAVFDITHY